MNYLAIDTCGQAIEILLYRDGKTVYRRDEQGRRASECLLTMIDQTLEEENLTLGEIDYFACVTGPGSFTGIRIGLNTIKSFAYVNKKPVLAVNSLERLAYNNTDESVESIVSVSYAYADFCYVAVYSPDGTVLLEPKCMLIADAQKLVSLVDEPSVVFADEKMSEIFSASKTDNVLSLTRVIEKMIAKNEGVSYAYAEPFYLVKSQAERELENK